MKVFCAAGGMWEGAEGGRWLCKQCSETVPEKDKSTHEDFHIALEMSRKQPGVESYLHPILLLCIASNRGEDQTMQAR